jgi:hypothetical protein
MIEFYLFYKNVIFWFGVTSQNAWTTPRQTCIKLRTTVDQAHSQLNNQVNMAFKVSTACPK